MDRRSNRSSQQECWEEANQFDIGVWGGTGEGTQNRPKGEMAHGANESFSSRSFAFVSGGSQYTFSFVTPLLIVLRGKGLEFTNLLDKVLLLVVELGVIGSIGLKTLQEADQLVPILVEYHMNGSGFGWTGNEYLKEEAKRRR